MLRNESMCHLRRFLLINRSQVCFRDLSWDFFFNGELLQSIYGLSVSVFQCLFSISYYLLSSEETPTLCATGQGSPAFVSAFLYVVHIDILHNRALTPNSLVTTKARWKRKGAIYCQILEIPASVT